jgi:hypothetical protein
MLTFMLNSKLTLMLIDGLFSFLKKKKMFTLMLTLMLNSKLTLMLNNKILITIVQKPFKWNSFHTDRQLNNNVKNFTRLQKSTINQLEN